MLLASPLETRNHLPRLVSGPSVGVEIGTHRGHFAKILLNNGLDQLHCIDPWDDVDGYELQAKSLPNKGRDRQEDLRVCEQHLLNYRIAGCCHLIKTISSGALSLFKDGSLDLVYVDGNHSYLHVKFDLVSWWTKLKPGGIMAGHDIVCPNEENGGWGGDIQRAVFEFAKGIGCGLDVFLIVEPNGLPWSYHMTKPNVEKT